MDVNYPWSHPDGRHTCLTSFWCLSSDSYGISAQRNLFPFGFPNLDHSRNSPLCTCFNQAGPGTLWTPIRLLLDQIVNFLYGFPILCSCSLPYGHLQWFLLPQLSFLLESSSISWAILIAFLSTISLTISGSVKIILPLYSTGSSKPINSLHRTWLCLFLCCPFPQLCPNGICAPINQAGVSLKYYFLCSKFLNFCVYMNLLLWSVEFQ